jgi:hypothetical protein
MKKALPALSKVAIAAIFAASHGAFAAQPQAQSFRADYGVVLDGLESALSQNGNSRSLKLLQQSRASLNTASDANLARIFGDAGTPDLSGTVSEMRRFSTRAAAKSAGLPGAGAIHSACASNPHDSESVYQALIAAQVTSSILSAATFVCTQDILGENGSAVCIPFAIADDIAQGIFAVRSWCAGEEGGAKSDASFERLDHVHSDLADARATILSDSSTKLTAILNNSNTNTVSIISNSNTNTGSIISNSNTNTGSIISNSNANTTTTNNNINASTASIINNSNQNKDAIVGELRALACELVRLLNTPDGQRSSSIAACMAQPGFPYSWNNKK